MKFKKGLIIVLIILYCFRKMGLPFCQSIVEIGSLLFLHLFFISNFNDDSFLPFV